MKKNDYLKAAKDLLEQETPRLPVGKVMEMVQATQAKTPLFQQAKTAFGSPLYIIDKQALQAKANRFRDTFAEHIPSIQPFFAMKCNNHPTLSRLLAEIGFGLDVSSGVELEQALGAGAEKILFSGPGKTVAELERAVALADKVTILVDSFTELKKLKAITDAKQQRIRIGVRLTVDENGLWRKFGISLSELETFIAETTECEYIAFSGLQFHSSWNLTPDNQRDFIVRLGETLRALPGDYAKMISFVDIGGGYWPEDGEWMHAEATQEGKLRELLDSADRDPLDHRFQPATPLKMYAAKIAQAIEKYITPYVQCTIYAEPGRWVAHESMYLMMSIEDKKRDDIAITDAGTNMIGWERFEMDYFPVVNIDRPALRENPCMVLGSLCTPHDVWGYSYFGDDLQQGDTLVIPSQGAYTYSLRQNFIKAIPASVVLDGNSVTPA